MAHVHFTRGKSYELASNCDENPTEYLESEGERMIKNMVQKQLNTQVSLQDQLQAPKEFEKCVEFVPLTKYTSGQISFSQFKEFADKVSHIENLKSLGLTEKEIELLCDHEKGEEHFEEKYKKVELSALKASLADIYKKLDKGAKEFAGQESGRSEKNVSRHELELSLSVKPESDHTKLLQFALSCQPSGSGDGRPLNHPINNLKELENELFGHLKPPETHAKRRRKRKKTEKKVQNEGNQTSPRDEIFNESPSLWDRRTVPKPEQRETQKEVKLFECAPKKLFTIKDGEIVPIEKSAEEGGSDVAPSVNASQGQPFVFSDPKVKSLDSSLQLVPVEEMVCNKIKGECMADHPHFKNYSKGEPSKVLYVKNIASTVTEDDLVSLFGNFESPGQNRITYRLLTGRMKGQAFITFPSIEKASLALEAVHGYNCKGKPLFVQFGKSPK